MRAALLLVLATMSGCLGGAETAQVTPVPTLEDFSKWWKNETSRVVMDAKHAWHNDPDPVFRSYNQYSQLVASPCVFQRDIYFNNRQVEFGGAGQGVVPGTARIETTLSWTDADYKGSQLVLGVLRANERDYEEISGYRRGVAKSFDVEREHWDSGDGGTEWEFWVCLHDSTQDGLGDMFEGSFTIKMVLHRLNATASAPLK